MNYGTKLSKTRVYVELELGPLWMDLQLFETDETDDMVSPIPSWSYWLAGP